MDTKQTADWIASVRKNLDELEKSIQPEKVEKVNIEYGYYLLDPGKDVLIKGDEYMGREGEWLLSKSIGSTIANSWSSCPPPYRRKIPIPDGFTLVTEGDSQHGDKYFYNNEWFVVAGLGTIPYNEYKALIRPITSQYPEGWWKEGDVVLHGSGYIENISVLTQKEKYQNHGRTFQTEEAAESYSKWELKNAERNRNLEQLEKEIKRLNDGWHFEPDLHFFKIRNKEIIIDFESTNTQHTSQSLQLYSREIGEQLLKHFGEKFIRTALGFTDKEEKK